MDAYLRGVELEHSSSSIGHGKRASKDRRWRGKQILLHHLIQATMRVEGKKVNEVVDRGSMMEYRT